MTLGNPSIITIAAKKLAGHKMVMSFAGNRTHLLWSGFMPHRHTIPDRVNEDLVSLQVYPERFMEDPQLPFVKWATVEVHGYEGLPEGMERFELPAGLYAAFPYTGLPAAAAGVFGSIFNEWLPASGYELDHRPHFEILGPGYKRDDPASTETIYIPICKFGTHNT
jgi:AraC family transcriptional regulator